MVRRKRSACKRMHKPWKQSAKSKRMHDEGTRAGEAAILSRKHDKPEQVDADAVLDAVKAAQGSGT